MKKIIFSVNILKSSYLYKMFSNEVPYEARGFTPDGIEIIVTEKAFAESEISYEDAWIKAYALAKEKAEAKLAETLKKLSEEVKDKLVLLKGERGCPGPRGFPGPAGPPGPTLPSYNLFVVSVPKDVTNHLASYLAYTPVDEPSNEVSTNIVNTFANLVNTELIGKLSPNSLDKNLTIASNFVTKLKDSQSIATFISFLNLLTSTISKEDFFQLQISKISLAGTNIRSKSLSTNSLLTYIDSLCSQEGGNYGKVCVLFGIVSDILYDNQ